MEKKTFKPKKRINNTNKKAQDNEPKVVYRTRQEGPEKKADWQLKLMAIKDCYDKKDTDNFKELVEQRYQALKHKYDR